MFPVTADSGECLPRQTMRLCSSEPLPTPCLCVHIGNISLPPPPPLPRETVATPLTQNSFLPCPIQPIAFFVLRGMPFVRSYARLWWIIARQILARPFCVARLSGTRRVPRAWTICKYHALKSRSLRNRREIAADARIFALYQVPESYITEISKGKTIDLWLLSFYVHSHHINTSWFT